MINHTINHLVLLYIFSLMINHHTLISYFSLITLSQRYYISFRVYSLVLYIYSCTYGQTLQFDLSYSSILSGLYNSLDLG